MKKYFTFFVLFITILMTYFTVTYCIKFDVLLVDDLFYPFKRTFFNPEHGRYIATFINNLFTDRLAFFFNMHPNEFNTTVTIHFKAILIVILCLLFSNLFFIFKKEDDKKSNILNFQFSNPAYILAYIFTFLFLFNQPQIYDCTLLDLAFTNTIFFEYPMSLLPCTIFFAIFTPYFIKNFMPDKNNYILLLITTFFMGLTVEAVNLPLVIIFGFLALYFFFNKNFKLKTLGLFAVFGISVLFYFSHGADHSPDYGGNFYSYLTNEFTHFLKIYCDNFISHYLLLIIPVVILLGLIAHLNKSKETKRFLFLEISVISATQLFLFSTFLFGYHYAEPFWAGFFKFVYICDMFILITLYMAISYLIFNCINLKKIKNDFILAGILFLIICIFNNLFIFSYPDTINKARDKEKTFREQMYTIEKSAISTNGETIPVPVAYKDLSTQVLAEERLLLWYLKYLYAPELNTKTKFVFTEEELNHEKSLNHLNFNKLLTKEKLKQRKEILKKYSR